MRKGTQGNEIGKKIEENFQKNILQGASVILEELVRRGGLEDTKDLSAVADWKIT